MSGRRAPTRSRRRWRCVGPGPRRSPATDTSTGIAVFLVPADAAGITVGTKDAKMGQEGSRTADVSFADVRVGPESLVGGDGDIG